MIDKLQTGFSFNAVLAVYTKYGRTGRLKRVQFLQYSMILVVVAATLFGVFYITLFLLYPDQGNGGDGFILIIIVLPISFLLLLFANICVKRIRDTGLPGWPIFFGLLILQFGLFQVGTLASNDMETLVFWFGLPVVVFSMLCMLPANIFSRSESGRSG